jgi:quinolinate synthase
MPILQALGPSAGHDPSAGRAPTARRGVLPMPTLEWNAQVERDTAHLYERVSAVIPAVE